MKLRNLLCAVALAGSAGLSAAVTPGSVDLVPTGPDEFSASFDRAVEGLFVDTISFNPMAFDGLVSVTLTSLTGPVSFFTASLNGQDFSYFPELGQDFMFSAFVTPNMPLMLTVFGAVLDADGNPNGMGSYRGELTATAVPEPQTYALLLTGLLGVGLAARRRASRTQRSAALTTT